MGTYSSGQSRAVSKEIDRVLQRTKFLLDKEKAAKSLVKVGETYTKIYSSLFIEKHF